MRQASALLLLLVAQAYTAPQLITFKDGKLGFNFGGYYAGIGLGGPEGLHAVAGTPHGQHAMAGLGGTVGTKGGGSTGGLYAQAQATENVHASAGLNGLTASNGFATGSGFANAQAGNQVASSSIGGQSSAAGSTGYKMQTFSVPATVVKETEVTVVPVETKPKYTETKKIHKEIKLEAENEVRPLSLSPTSDAHLDAKFEVKSEAQPSTVLVKQVYVEPQPQIIQKTKIRTHYKPHHHVHKTAYIGGYIGGGADLPPPPPIQKRIDVGVDASGNVGVEGSGRLGGDLQGHGSETTITKQVTVEKNPTFFADIFNIPISTLQAVGNFLSNSAANTKVSVQKSASVEADTVSKHAPLSSSPSSSSSSSTDTHISVETPSVSQIIDGIFSIPINTLGAVNKFLENNITGRKRVQVQESTGEAAPARVRLGPHARRRANKVVYVERETSDNPTPDETQ